MKAIFKNDALHIYRDDIGGVEVKVTGKSEKALKNLENQLNSRNIKFFSTIEQIKNMKDSIIESRNSDKTGFIPGLPNTIKQVGMIDSLYDKSTTYKDTKERKEPPAWLNYVKDDIKQKKRIEDEKDKKWKDGEGETPNLRPYSDEVYNGYAKGFVKFWEQNPKYEAPSYESEAGLDILVKGAMWGWKKKLNKDPESRIGAWIGRMGLFREKAEKALIRNYASKDILSKGIGGHEEKDDYTTDEANNKIFQGLSKEERQKMYSLMNLSQREIDGIEMNIRINDKDSDAGNLMSFKDILKAKESINETIYTLAKLQEKLSMGGFPEKHFDVDNLNPSIQRYFTRNNIQDIYIGQRKLVKDLHKDAEIKREGYTTYGRGGAKDEDFNNIFLNEGPGNGHPAGIHYGNFYWAIVDNDLRISGRSPIQDSEIINNLGKVMQAFITRILYYLNIIF
jgi:hypothetical protein